ncbi:MAG TPA: hypothetical protein PLB89_03265 [Flavobacteriales bacterium]|nr:hypothetical protein [Flavobacteriales bacterium]
MRPFQSMIRSFSILASVILGSPYTGQAAQTPCSVSNVDPAPYVTLSWDAVGGALTYTVEYTTDAGFLNNILQVGVTGLATQTQATSLQYGTTYYWRLRSNSAPSWQTPVYTYGSICTFSTTAAATQPPQFAPQQSSPRNNSGMSSPYPLTFYWQSYGGATGYEVQWSTNPTLSSNVLTSPVVTTTSWLAGAMTQATTYYWRVRAYNSLGAGSWANSPIWRFDTESVATPITFKAFLQGPLVTTPSVSMTDGLRSGGYIPTTEPYFSMFFPPNQNPYLISNYPSITMVASNALSVVSTSVLAATGAQAVVDWVVVEARHGSANIPMKSWVMLLRKDGSMVLPEGGTLNEQMPMKNMKFAIRHRNHLGAMTANAVDMVGTALTFDFTATSTVLHGTNPTYIAAGKRALWAGDCNGNGTVAYSGAENDRDKVLSAIGGIVPTNFVDGYRTEDVNMNGRTLYTGSANDRDLILSVIGGIVPTNTKTHQLP